MRIEEIVNDNVLYSETDANKAYQQTLLEIQNIFDGSAANGVEIMTPFLVLSEQLSSCTPVQAQVIYADLSRGYSLISQLYGKAIFDRDKSKSELKAKEGICYLEEFSKYAAEMKSKGITIKDTDVARNHYIASNKEVIEAKLKVDFYEAYAQTLKGWQAKIYADMNNAKNLVYGKRYSDDLSTKAN